MSTQIHSTSGRVFPPNFSTDLHHPDAPSAEPTAITEQTDQLADMKRHVDESVSDSRENEKHNTTQPDLRAIPRGKYHSDYKCHIHAIYLHYEEYAPNGKYDARQKGTSRLKHWNLYTTPYADIRLSLIHI